MDGEGYPIMPRPINYLVSSAIDNTSAHQNIDTLLLQSKLDEQIKNESLYGAIYADKSPEYKGGIDPVVENIAMSPIMTLKSLGSVGKKILEKTSLRNPLYHFTSAPKASGIIKSGAIRGADKAFPGKSRRPAVSVTRDPKFSSRPHKHVGTDVRFIMDRDEMVKKGLKIEPFSEERYRKTRKMTPYGEEVGGGGDLASEFFDEIDKKSWIEMNPMFEFEERVRGNIPTENIKLIDLLRFPMGESGISPGLIDFINRMGKSNIPIIKSEDVAKKIKTIKNILNENRRHPFHPIFMDENPRLIDYLDKIQKAPTYTYNPFKSK
jgi:hypothetical protein